MTVGGRVGALWIGGLEPYMDEAFLQVKHFGRKICCLAKINMKKCKENLLLIVVMARKV